jgi:hypothetical protein
MSSPLGVALHLAGSVCIVTGQTAVKVWLPAETLSGMRACLTDD